MPPAARTAALLLSLATVASTALLSAASGPAWASSSPAITGGAPDGTAHPYVAMVLPPGASRPTCTGVLVRADNGRSVVLTDAHCLYRDGRHSGTGVRVTFAPDFGSSAPLLSGSFVVDPAYDPATHLHDVAVVRVSTPLAPARLPALGAAQVPAGTVVDTVGTGQPYSGHRRTATEVVTSASSDWLYLEAGSGNSCDGDSGGPDLVRATSTVLALTDQGTCSYDQDTRLDTVRVRPALDRAAGLSATRTTVQYGSTGTDVRVVQNLLGAAADGSFGTATRSLVLSWQRRHGLTADGVVGPRTWASLGF